MGTWGAGKERITNSLKRDAQVSRERQRSLLLGAGRESCNCSAGVQVERGVR